MSEDLEGIRETLKSKKQDLAGPDDVAFSPGEYIEICFYVDDVSLLLAEVERLRGENEAMREKLEGMIEEAPLGEEPLAYWGGYRSALFDLRDALAGSAKAETHTD